METQRADERNRLVLTPEVRENLNEVAKYATQELIVFFRGQDEKPKERARLAMMALANYAKLHQSENGAQRILITALDYCMVNDPVERRRYISLTMPQLNFVPPNK